MAEIIPADDPRRAPKPRPLSDFVHCNICGFDRPKEETHCFSPYCPNSKGYVKPKDKRKGPAKA